jgi:hypothetical protein
MSSPALVGAVLSLLAGCGSSGHGAPPTAGSPSGGGGGSGPGTGGSGGELPPPGNGGAGPTGGAGGTTPAPPDASPVADASTALPTALDAGRGDAPVVAGVAAFCGGTLYQATTVCGANAPQATPCTVLTGRAHAGGGCMNCMTCPPDGQQCCPAPSGATGGVVGNLLRGGGDSITFTNVYAPADGDYNIVWYYYCANADTNGYSSPTCGTAAPQGSMTGNPGCREAEFTVNGVADPKVYEFPCFLRISPQDHGWGHVHSWVRSENVKSSVLVPFHLKAGATNTIKIFARGHDAPNVAAIRVPDGK